MDANDVRSPPEWRSTGTMNLSVPGHPIGSPASSEYDATTISSNSEMIQTGLDVAPNESSICDRLIDQIRAVSGPKSEVAAPFSRVAPFHSLEEALKQTSTTIRYNAKWFAEEPLNLLLETALTAAATSSASADLYAALTLIDNVTTYSLLPTPRLQQTAAFLSQTYYAATRAHKTKKLADASWLTLKHILESHLGGQTVVALLEIVGCSAGADLESRLGYAQVAGALMIISEKLILKDELRHTVSLPSLTQLLDKLWLTVVNGDDNIREAIMDIIPVLLEDDHAVGDLDAQSSWDVLLDTVEPCITLTPGIPAATRLVESMVLHIDRFESRKLPNIAALALDADLPLPPHLSENILAPWEDVLPTRDIPNAYSRLLRKLSKSSRYLQELSFQIDKGMVELFERTFERKAFAVFVQTLVNIATDSATIDDASEILAKALVKLFRHSIRFPGRHSETRKLFEALCSTSARCIAAAEALFLIRADVAAVVYVESGLHSQTFPAHSLSSSVTAVMHDASSLPLQDWHNVIMTTLHGSPNWEIYYYFLNQMPFLLGNHTMFDNNIEFVKRIGTTVCELLESGLYPEPPSTSGLTKSHVAVAFIRILTVALSYHHHLSKQEVLQLVSSFLNIAGSRDHLVSIPCIHALTICCYELPDLMASYMDDVIDKTSKMVTQRYLAIHVLLFLAGLSRQPDLFHNFQAHDYKKIFGVCGSYLQSIRGTSGLAERQRTAPSSDQSSNMSVEPFDALPQYVYALAHHVIAFWYTAIKSQDRRELKEYITSCLRYTTPDGDEVIEDQGLVTIDLMDRVDAIEPKTESIEAFDHMDGRTTVAHRLSGLLLITTETAMRTAKTIVTVRRATGTDKWVVKSDPYNQKQRTDSVAVTIDSSEDDFICIFPPDIAGRTCGKVYIPHRHSVLGSDTSLALPNDDVFVRAIQSFDRTSALDSHKAGVIYIGEGQTTEDEILQNQMGSPDYVDFAINLGSLVRLKEATFNTQGLDRTSDTDGQHAVVWHNQLTELVFHVTTLMPNSDDIKLNTASKKRHIGNDYVNIVFNNSGAPFDFNTFPSSFNFVYIVITPSARTSFLQTRTHNLATDEKDRFYAVQVMTREGYPSVSSAAEEKIISGASLAAYVRNLALNECVFSLMWAHKDEPGEYPSSWRSRLHQIRRFWERYASTGA